MLFRDRFFSSFVSVGNNIQSMAIYKDSDLVVHVTASMTLKDSLIDTIALNNHLLEKYRGVVSWFAHAQNDSE